MTLIEKKLRNFVGLNPDLKNAVISVTNKTVYFSYEENKTCYDEKWEEENHHLLADEIKCKLISFEHIKKSYVENYGYYEKHITKLVFEKK